MKKMDGAKLFAIVLVAAIVIGVGVYILSSFSDASRKEAESTELARTLQEIWDNGESVMGTAVQVGKAKDGDNVELRYAVDGVDYKATCTIDEKSLKEIDGEDADGQGEVEIHYDPDDPQTATVEAALNMQKRATKLNTVLKILMGGAFVYLMWSVIAEMNKRKR